LALETVEKAFAITPEIAQTGPAIREDELTIKKHLELLEDPFQKETYRLITEAIMNSFR
jgi:hypothetical protein